MAIININAAREAIRDTRSSVSKKLPTASAMADKVYDTDAGQEYLDECIGAMTDLAEKDPSILWDDVKSADTIDDCVRMIDPEVLRETIRETLYMNAATSADELRQSLIEANNYLADADPEEIDGFTRQLAESMNAVKAMWSDYEPLFSELISEMDDDVREGLISASAEIATYIEEGGLKGTVLEDYADILMGTWQRTYELAVAAN